MFKTKLPFWVSIIWVAGAVIYVTFLYHNDHKKQLRDYQIQCTNDTLYLYDGNKLIGTTEWGNNGIEQIILLDNQ